MPGTFRCNTGRAAYLTHKDLYFVQLNYYENDVNTKSLELSDYTTSAGQAYPLRLSMVRYLNDSRTDLITTMLELDSKRIQAQLFTVEYLKG